MILMAPRTLLIKGALALLLLLFAATLSLDLITHELQGYLIYIYVTPAPSNQSTEIGVDQAVDAVARSIHLQHPAPTVEGFRRTI